MADKTLAFAFAQLYPEKTGGAEIFNYHLITEISKNREVFLISYYDPCIKGVKFHRLMKFRPQTLFYPLQLFYVLWRNRSSISSVYTSFMQAPWTLYFPITLFSFITKVPYTFTIHGGGLTKWKFQAPFIRFFKGADRISGVSYRICDEYYKRTGVKIEFLPPLIPFQTSNKSKYLLREKYKISYEKNMILFVGSLKPLKNPILLIKAMNALGKAYLKNKNILAVYAGDGKLKHEMETYILENNMSEYVYIAGNVPHELIHEFYAMSDYYIISSRFEGTPLSLLEAMFNKLPIMASNAPGINNLLIHDETALLYDTENYLELSNLLAQLIDNPEKGAIIGSHAAIYFQRNFDYNEILDKYLNIIDI